MVKISENLCKCYNNGFVSINLISIKLIKLPFIRVINYQFSLITESINAQKFREEIK